MYNPTLEEHANGGVEVVTLFGNCNVCIQALEVLAWIATTSPSLPQWVPICALEAIPAGRNSMWVTGLTVAMLATVHLTEERIDVICGGGDCR